MNELYLNKEELILRFATTFETALSLVDDADELPFRNQGTITLRFLAGKYHIAIQMSLFLFHNSVSNNMSDNFVEALTERCVHNILNKCSCSPY